MTKSKGIKNIRCDVSNVLGGPGTDSWGIWNFSLMKWAVEGFRRLYWARSRFFEDYNIKAIHIYLATNICIRRIINIWEWFKDLGVCPNLWTSAEEWTSPDCRHKLLDARLQLLSSRRGPGASRPSDLGRNWTKTKTGSKYFARLRRPWVLGAHFR